MVVRAAGVEGGRGGRGRGGEEGRGRGGREEGGGREGEEGGGKEERGERMWKEKREKEKGGREGSEEGGERERRRGEDEGYEKNGRGMESVERDGNGIHKFTSLLVSQRRRRLSGSTTCAFCQIALRLFGL